MTNQVQSKCSFLVKIDKSQLLIEYCSLSQLEVKNWL